MNTKGVLKGAIVSCIITMLVFFVFSMLYSCMDLEDDFLEPIVKVTVIISIAIGAIISCRDINNKGWINGITIGFLYTVIMLILGMVQEGKTNISMELLLINLSIGLFFGIVGVNKKRKRNN